ncbi:MAG: DNA methyltransferase [Bacteroidota bacterium]|nr:DNA methyltransferase [Bacteroidota bacterium]
MKKISKEFQQTVPQVNKPNLKHLNRQIPPEAHTSMYNFHKYWSRKTWNVVGQFIETYCPVGGIVFDPFSGSGVTAIEALKRGRKAIVCDIIPVATELTRLTIKNIPLLKIQEVFRRIEEKVKNRILELYKTKCRKCGKEIVFDCAIWIKNECVDIRYQKCPDCGDERRGDTKLEKYDKDLISKIDKHKIKEWYPNNKLYHANGKPFKEKQQYESVDGLFTKRNLYALAILMEEIENESDKNVKDFLKIAFTSMLHLCSRLLAEGRPGYRPFSGVGWNQQSYWFTPRYMESNVWEKFESAILGRQGLINAKEESNKYFENVRFGQSFEDVVSGKSDIFIYTGSCLDLIKKMITEYGKDGCVDYVFTDPPYDSSIQYGELSYMWVSWLKKDEGYLEKIALDEIIHNERQDKNFDTYHSLLSNSFEGIFNLLKPENYLTVTFHNPTFKVRNATIRAGVLSGFELQKVHHQELARPSAKSLLQPFGSAQGDFYLRFYKPNLGEKGAEREAIDELRFDKIVYDTSVKILAERGEPTPYTIIINAIDPELARRGYFSELNTGLDVKTALEKHIDNEFILVDAKRGGAQGKLWWFKNPGMVPHLQKIPLTERVERTVLAKLQQKGKVTFTDIWEAVSISFPNSLTSDQTSIREALEVYAKPMQQGYWLIKNNFKRSEAEREHSTIIAILSEIGQAAGYDIYIGKNEQSHDLNSPIIKTTGKLNQYLTYKNVFKLKNVQNPDVVDDIDLLWIKNHNVEYAFEVESTTPMTDALQRCSNLEKTVSKVMLFPVDRENQFKQKLKSPMFYERFQGDNWSVVLFDVLYESWNKDKKRTCINDILNKPTTIQKQIEKKKNQLTLFQSNTIDEQPNEDEIDGIVKGIMRRQ